MKRLAYSAISLLLLAACASNTPSVTYNMTIDTTDPEERSLVGEEVVRVIERRLERMGEVLADKDLQVKDDSARITVAAEHQEALDRLTQELQQPFVFAVMKQGKKGTAGGIAVEGHGTFVPTGITGEDLTWIEARQNPTDSTGEVQLVFTEEGRTKMANLFEEMKGKSIGIFVRGVLVSKLQVDSATLKDQVIIRQIPTPELAFTFADDVNVGIHVTFTPVP